MWTTAEISALQSMCNPGSIVFDVGAHHGFLTILFAKWAGATGHVHAFEANPPNALVLDANLGLNRLNNCTRTVAAVGPCSGSIRISGEAVSSGPDCGRLVQEISLDDYFESAATSHVDLIKIDVEGFEGQVLRGCPRLLACRPKIALELHVDDLATFGDSVDSVLGLLPLDHYHGQVMIRPDFKTLSPWLGRENPVPLSGVANIFLWPDQ